MISRTVRSISLDIRERMVAMGIAESINDRQPAQYCHPRAWFPASLWNEIRQSAFADWRGPFLAMGRRRPACCVRHEDMTIRGIRGLRAQMTRGDDRT
jgi:hypothetical protein